MKPDNGQGDGYIERFLLTPHWYLQSLIAEPQDFFREAIDLIASDQGDFCFFARSKAKVGDRAPALFEREQSIPPFFQIFEKPARGGQAFPVHCELRT